MLVLHDPGTLTHETVEILGARLIPALESPNRILAILKAVRDSSNHILCSISGKENLVVDVLRTTHNLAYLEHLKTAHRDWVAAGHIAEGESILPECFPTFAMPHSTKDEDITRSAPTDVFARSGYYAFDMSTGIMSETYYAALCSANLAAHAVSLIMSEPGLSVAMALCRPPGHHCDTTKAGGYCYLNNCVVAVESIIQSAQKSIGNINDNAIVILDLDFHHGNGTQSYFYDRQVRYVSIHGENEYPYYSGSQTEHGSGIGFGYNHNFPMPQKSSLIEYLRILKLVLNLAIVETTRYLVLSLGFDTFATDPLGSFDLQTSDYNEIARLVNASLQQKQVKTVILLEGGYVIEELGANVLAFLNGWEEAAC